MKPCARCGGDRYTPYDPYCDHKRLVRTHVERAWIRTNGSVPRTDDDRDFWERTSDRYTKGWHGYAQHKDGRVEFARGATEADVIRALEALASEWEAER